MRGSSALGLVVTLGLASACGSNELDPIQSTGGAGGALATSGSSSSGSSGTSTPTSGTGGSTKPTCKRGIATNTPPGAGFEGGIGWFYDWSLATAAAAPGIEFVPMVWGSKDLGKPVPGGAAFLLGFNEPNFHAQSNLTPQEAAAAWPQLEATGLRLVSPAMNFCGPAASCNGTSPYQYLKDFFAACPGCKVDYVAVHWYNCDLPSLKDYLEPGGNLEGFEQFNLPIWVTELSCDGTASVAQQQAYMQEAIPYLESNPHVYRYSWFSADPIPNAKLVNADGSPTALGAVYAGLDKTCQP